MERKETDAEVRKGEDGVSSRSPGGQTSQKQAAVSGASERPGKL